MQVKGLLSVIALVASGIMTAQAEVTAHLGGRLQMDAALYDEDVTELGSGTEIRRARLFVDGMLEEDWGYKLQFDFADGEVDIKDAYVRYTGSDIGRITIGQSHVPFGLEELTSSKYITFMERAQLGPFIPSRRLGVGLDRKVGEAGLFMASVYGDEAGDNNADEGFGFGARYVFSPKTENDVQLHFAGAFASEEAATTDTGEDVARFRERPESHVTSRRLVDTGNIAGVERINRFGLEAAAVMGAFSLQAEYMSNELDTASESLSFDGYYAYASWFPGGQTRNYKGGKFERTKASNAWEVAVRFSHLNLDDGTVFGGEQENLTLGVNYYVSPYLRFMGNVVLVDVKGGINGDEDPSLVQFRLAYDFK